MNCILLFLNDGWVCSILFVFKIVYYFMFCVCILIVLLMIFKVFFYLKLKLKEKIKNIDYFVLYRWWFFKFFIYDFILSVYLNYLNVMVLILLYLYMYMYV